jgi:hypothetical protein
MLAFPIDPNIYNAIEGFLHVSPDRGERGSYRRAMYNEARNAFVNEAIRLNNLGKITHLRKFVRAVFVLRNAPDVYRAHHLYMTKYQIVRLVGEVGTVNSKIFVKAFGFFSRSNRNALLEIEKYLNSVSRNKTYTTEGFQYLKLNCY